MLEWIASDEEYRPGEVPAYQFRFATEQGPGEVRLYLDLRPAPGSAAPQLACTSSPPGCALTVQHVPGRDAHRVTLTVPPASHPEGDDEVTIDVTGDAACRVVLRRTACAFRTALLEGACRPGQVHPQTRAALLWHGWGRHSELVGLKRFTVGRSGADVLVFRPRLREPDVRRPTLESSSPAGVLGGVWGSYLLAKTS